MKTERNILFAFILNLSFSIFEFIGGFLTNSVSISSDAIHDMGDAISIGISYFLEKISKKKADDKYTYGYVRYSVLGGFITTVILIVGSIIVIYNAIGRIINPVKVNYSGMLIFAIIGVLLNTLSAFITRKGDSINQHAVNLHMLEDVLGWIIVLIGSIIMKFTDISIIDPIMSIGVTLFILINAFKNLKRVFDIFLEKIPSGIDLKNLKEDILKIQEIEDIHHVHIWSIDGYSNYATMHIVVKNKNVESIKSKIREELEKYGIFHSNLEIEEELCDDIECNLETVEHHRHHH